MANWRMSDPGPHCWANDLTSKEGVFMKYNVIVEATVKAKSAEAAEQMVFVI